jgi:hypothetical protein
MTQSGKCHASQTECRAKGPADPHGAYGSSHRQGFG